MNLSQNKLQWFLELAAAGEVDEAYSNYTGRTSHHNPLLCGDATSLKEGMRESKLKPQQSL